jgi:hypothetical protein
MDKKGVSELAAEIARDVIARGVVEDEEGEWFLSSLGAAVLFEADERGLENDSEIAEEAVRLHSRKA